MTTANLDHQDLNNALSAPGLVREEVMEKIWLIDKYPLEFTDIASSMRSGNRFTEYTTDELGAPADPGTNAHVDGADITQNDTVIGERLGNHHQIMVKNIQVSTRANAVRSIGRIGSVAYQVMRAQQRLRRDAEAQYVSDKGAQEDDGNATPGILGGFFAWAKTNVQVVGDDGTPGGYNTGTKLVVAPTPSTNAGQLTEKAIRDVAQAVWEAGGDTSYIHMRPPVYRKLSEYLMSPGSRVATQTNYNQGEEAGRSSAGYGSVSVFITDYGQVLMMVANRLQPVASATNGSPRPGVSHMAFIDPKHQFNSFITGYRVEPLAKTGLSAKRMISVDTSLLVANEKSIGAILDIDETQDVIAG